MDYLSHNISINLRRIRQSKSMSLEQAAEQTGVSKSMLAQIEKGTANPSLGVLGKITSGLRIEFQRLIETPREYLTVTDGVLTVECRGHVQRIARQEAYKFETDQMHIYRNEGTERASCFCFFLDCK